MKFLLLFLGAYLVGSIPTAYLAAKFLKQIDIRKVGSGNVGATNAFRVLGKGPGIFVLAVDFMKGFAPTLIFSNGLLLGRESALWLGSGAILGHIFTPYLKFKGGKGIATGAGVLCASFPGLFASSLVVWLISLAVFKIVSVSSLLAVASVLIAALLLHPSRGVLIYAAAMMFLTLWTHRSNLRKLARGDEDKIVSR